MEQKVIFRDYMEQQAQDHNDIQSYARASIDHLVHDAVTATRRYSGFETVKTTQTEVQIAAGRFYDVDGGIYNLATTTVQSMLSYLAVSAQRIVTVSAYGVENETDVEERDYLVNVTTGLTEPKAATSTSSRDAVLTLTTGAESADPQPPSIPVANVKICDILLDNLSVVSVTMAPEFEVPSVEDLDTRVDAVETFEAQIGPRVSSLASDLAALAAKLKLSGTQLDVVTLYRDLAELKEKVGLPASYAQYGADYFLDQEESDMLNAAGLGFDAAVEMGVRMAAANADIFEISLFSALDPNATLTSGLLLPKFSSELKLSISEYYNDLGIAQYGYQTYALKQGKIHKERLRYGGQYLVCSNGVMYMSAQGDNVAPTWLPDFETYETVNTTGFQGWHSWATYDYWWHDSWTESYWYLETIDHNITGAQVAETFLVSNDTWATKLGWYITAKGGAENILVSLCEVSHGQPDLEKVILHQSYPHASIVTGWNRMDIVPTFLERGKRYALVLTSNANHRIGMAYGQSYLDGTFFTSTDGVYSLGDLMKDMMIEVWGAKFQSSQVTLEFAPINLDGGLRAIDITAATIVPDSCQLVYEMRPNGTGEWQQLTPDNVAALNGAPPLCQFRARFVGTRDIQPGLMLTGSRVYVQRPKLAFRHVSTQITLGTGSTNIHVQATIEGFDDTPHDLNCHLRIGGADENPASTTLTLIDIVPKRYRKEWAFTPSSTTQFRIVFDGTTNSAASLFHIAERLYYAV